MDSDLVSDLVVEFDEKRPGYDTDVEFDDGEVIVSDNYFEAGRAFICGRLRRAGIDPMPYGSIIDERLEHIRGMGTTAAMVAAEGGGGREELEIADMYRGMMRPVLRSREEVRRHAQRLTAIRIRPPSLRRGRERRAACNNRTRGSRRASTSSRGDPDLGDEPPSHSRLLVGGRS